MDDKRVRYKCDPALHTTCKKTACHINGGPCMHTTHLEFAKQPVETVMMVFPMGHDEAVELGLAEYHTAVRVNDLMYKGCEPHWQCTKCGEAVPFHCWSKSQFEQQICKITEDTDNV